MGRPLNKKYFGNRNIGTTGTSDNAIGGEGIASINWSTLGAFQGNSNVQVLTAIPALPAPSLPGGVQATWTMEFEVESVSTGSGKTNLAVGDTFENDTIPGMIAKVTDISGTNAVFSVTTTGASRGDALALADIPQDTVGITLTKIAGTGTAITFFVDILFRVKESTVTITEKGSGYVGTETFTFAKPGTTSGDVPAGTIVLTTENGVTYSSDNQENAIIASAQLPGGSDATVDIISQRGSRRFRVTDGTRTGVCALTASATLADGEMSITATDVEGNTYYITKLSGRKATLTQVAGGADYVYADGEVAPWRLEAADGLYVKINNA